MATTTADPQDAQSCILRSARAAELLNEAAMQLTAAVGDAQRYDATSTHYKHLCSVLADMESLKARWYESKDNDPGNRFFLAAAGGTIQ